MHEDMLIETASTILENNKKELDELSVRQLYTLYRVASCLYYQFDTSMMSDEKFDLICQYLLSQYNEEWVHVPREELVAGTGFSINHGTTTINICQTIIKLGLEIE